MCLLDARGIVDDTEDVKMHTLSAIAALVLLIAMFMTVYMHIGAEPSASSSGTWGSGSLVNPLANSTDSTPQEPNPNLYQVVESGPPFYYRPLSGTPSSGPITLTQPDDTDFRALIASLSEPQVSVAASSSVSALPSTYSFIPQGLLGTTSPAIRTATQQQLYDYGNEAGAIVQNFESTHTDMTLALQNQFQDPTNADKIAALDTLAGGLGSTGAELLSISYVPPQAASLNTSLGNDYKTMAAKLALVGSAQGDQGRGDAMKAYNQAADSFIKHYVALVMVFSSYGVSFSSGDPGSVFTFSGGF